MNAPEFRRRVMAQERPGLSNVSLAFAADFFVSQHRLTEGDVRSCIELAGRYEAAYPFHPGDTAASMTSAVPISLGAVIASDRWADELRPSIEKLRQEIFGSPHPPFKTAEEAPTALTGTDKGVIVDQRVRELAGATGIPSSAIAAYVLADVNPSSPRQRSASRSSPASCRQAARFNGGRPGSRSIGGSCRRSKSRRFAARCGRS